MTREEVLADLVGLLPSAEVVDGNGWPARIRFFDGVRHIEASVYLSRIGDPGAGATGARPVHERRFQNPGQGHPIHIDPDVPTLLLGLADGEAATNATGATPDGLMPAVIAAFDAARHAGKDTRISVQMRVDTLRAAAANGFQTQLKANGELIVAFGPEYIGEYIDSMLPLVHTGEEAVPDDAEDVQDLFELVQAIEVPEDSKISDAVADAFKRYERERVRTTSDRKVRDARFRRRVVTSYGGSCAMCGMQLDVLIGAHIDPVEADGPDEVRNGMALCPNHHSAFDRHLIEVDENQDFAISLNEERVRELENRGLAGGIDDLRNGLFKKLQLPQRTEDRPHPEYFKRRRSYYFPETSEVYDGDAELL